jgi:DNA-binding LytR/AlgR family response regulator
VRGINTQAWVAPMLAQEPGAAVQHPQSQVSSRSRPGQPGPSLGGIDQRLALDPVIIIGEREHRFYPLTPQSIDYIESDGNYLTLRANAAEYITRDSIKRLERLLQPYGFIRIERSLLVNSRAIAYLQRNGRGTFAFTLTNGACLQSTATFLGAILRVFPVVASRR